VTFYRTIYDQTTVIDLCGGILKQAVMVFLRHLAGISEGEVRKATEYSS
jgi:hypothetical protein